MRALGPPPRYFDEPNLFSEMVLEVTGSYKVKYEDKEIDFTPPFKRIRMLPGLEEKLGVKIPPLESPGICCCPLVPFSVPCCFCPPPPPPPPHPPKKNQVWKI